MLLVCTDPCRRETRSWKHVIHISRDFRSYKLVNGRAHFNKRKKKQLCWMRFDDDFTWALSTKWYNDGTLRLKKMQNVMAHLVASLKRDSPSRIITICSGTFPPDFRIELTATASVLDVIAANKAACCQYHPNFARSKTYKSTGTMMKVLASTTRRANEMMCKRTCI